ncbi:MAG: cation:proton antiporter [Phycisphaerales bacterium]|nr:cation:proton antiporter [Planctomycetota bacterium]MCH8507229.1 cation:proton antiporter [Phycisphaerales bacterium]
MPTTLFNELAIILMIAAVLGAIGTLLRQPLIVAFIAVGILVGPAALDIVTMAEEMELLATIGISILLFVVGLKLDLEVIRTTGPIALATGLGQVLFTSVVGFGICMLLGMSTVTSLYIAVALTFSSTIIIVKLLSDKREIDALHGRIAVGFLIVQDIVVVLVMIALSAFGATTGAGEGEQVNTVAVVLGVLGKGAAMLIGIGLLMRFVLPGLVRVLARSQELLILFAIAWAVSMAMVGDMLGFSKEVGAFLAGVALASTPFRETISGRLVSIRDFMLLFFFLHLGSTLDLSTLGAQVGVAVILSLFVLIGNPLIVLIIMGAMGYRKRTGFLAGLTVAQISEFSLILGALGLTLGHINEETMGLITLVGLITIGLSTYLIMYSHQIYARIERPLSIFERKVPYRELREGEPTTATDAIIIFGLGRFGDNIARELRGVGAKIIGVDFDPRIVGHWRREDRDAQYGDACDPEFPASLPLSSAAWVVCAVPDLKTNLTLTKALREHHYEGKIALTAHTAEHARILQDTGVDLVLLPFADAAKHAAECLMGQAEPSEPPPEDSA